MTPKGFDAPPFVVWRVITKRKDPTLPFPRRIAAQSHHEIPNDWGVFDLDGSEFSLVPHAVFFETMRQARFQCAVLGISLFLLLLPFSGRIPCWVLCADHPLFAAALRALLLGLGLALVLIPTFTCLAIAANLAVIALLNARPMQTTKALLQLCPEGARRLYDESFPSIIHARYAVIDRLRITLQTFHFFRFGRRQSRKITWLWRERAVTRAFLRGGRNLRARIEACVRTCRRALRALRWREHERLRVPARLSIAPWMAAPPRSYCKQATDRRVNRAKLGSLSLRREDSRLQALSAFAAATTFVPQRRRHSVIGRIHINFLMSYFSPIGFGFALCMLLVAAFACGKWLAHFQHLSRVPLIVSVMVWFAQGLWYVKFTLGQDFASLFRDYFALRIFPKSMTTFAQAQIGAAPELATEVPARWLNFLVVGLLLGLASLHAALLHSLGD